MRCSDICVPRFAGGQRYQAFGRLLPRMVGDGLNHAHILGVYYLVVRIFIHIPVILRTEDDLIPWLEIINMRQRLAIPGTVPGYRKIADRPGLLRLGIMPQPMHIELLDICPLNNIAHPFRTKTGYIYLGHYFARLVLSLLKGGGADRIGLGDPVCIIA